MTTAARHDRTTCEASGGLGLILVDSPSTRGFTHTHQRALDTTHQPTPETPAPQRIQTKMEKPHCSGDVGRLSEYWSGEAADTFGHFMQSRDQEIGKLAQALVDFHHLLSKTIKGMEDLCAIFVSRINDVANSVATGIAIAGAGGIGILVGGAAAGPFGAAAGGMIAEVIMEAVSAAYLIYDLIKTMIADIPKIIEAWQISSEVKSSDPAGGLHIGRPYGGPDAPY